MCNFMSRHPVIILSAKKHFCQTPTGKPGGDGLGRGISHHSLLFSPLFLSGVLLYRWDKQWVFLLSLSLRVSATVQRERNKGNVAGEQQGWRKYIARGWVCSTKCNYAMGGESVRPERGFQPGLMEPQAWSPGMAPKSPWPLSGARGA